MAGNVRNTACVAAAIIALTIAIIAIIVITGARAKPPGRDGFFTEHGREEPTRSWVAYTGTIPFGVWGNSPWAEANPGPAGCAKPWKSLPELNEILAARHRAP